MKEPIILINRTDALWELDQLLINRPLEPERKLINACKKRIMELPIVYPNTHAIRSFRVPPTHGHKDVHSSDLPHIKPKEDREDL